MRTELTLDEIKVREKVYQAAMQPAQTVHPDEDEIVFTRTELKALWDSILFQARGYTALLLESGLVDFHPSRDGS